MDIKEQIINRVKKEIDVKNIDHILNILDKEFTDIKYTVVVTDIRRFISNHVLEIDYAGKKDRIEIMIHALDINSYMDKVNKEMHDNPLNALRAYKLMFTINDPEFCSNLEIKKGIHNISIF